MRIIIDHREKKILDVVRKIFPDVEVKVLPIGDLLLLMEDYAVVLERKAVPDFISSIRSNRLWEQLLKLLKAHKIFDCEIRRRILLIHGSISNHLYVGDFEGNGLSRFWSSLAGAMLEILFVYDTPIIFVENDDAFSSFLRILIKREMDGLNDGLPKSRWYQKVVGRKLPVKERKLLILDAIPDIGEVLSKNLLEYFGSIMNIANASIKELQRVPGIGREKAKRIYEAFH